jgi:protease-4
MAKQEKPVIVSMGDVAASGGYYIACAADSILAEPTTITGSIGVFGMAVNMEKFWKNKLGVTFDRYKTEKYADLGNPNRAMTNDEEEIIRFMIYDIYGVFKRHVADGRKMNVDSVEAIAQGRVWTGEQALKIHLIDKIGGLYDAIEIARKMAKIDNYKLIILPKSKNPFEKFFSMFSSTDIKTYLLKASLGDDYELFQKAKMAREMNGCYMLMPYSMDIN